MPRRDVLRKKDPRLEKDDWVVSCNNHACANIIVWGLPNHLYPSTLTTEPSLSHDSWPATTSRFNFSNTCPTSFCLRSLHNPAKFQVPILSFLSHLFPVTALTFSSTAITSTHSSSLDKGSNHCTSNCTCCC